MRTKLILKLLICSLFIASSTAAQEWIETAQLPLKATPISFSIDTEDNIYLGFENGSLRKFSASGEELPRFSLPNQSALTLIEAQNNRKIFIFQRDIQQITILDRFSAQPKQYLLENFGLSFASQVCPAQDGSIWAVENNPPRLKKIDVLRNVIIHEIQHQLGDSIHFMKTERNLLLISDENGLQTFDQFGNSLSQQAIDLSYFHFSNSEVVGSTPSGFVRIDPYNSIIQEKTHLPTTEIRSVIKLKDNYAVVTKKSLSFFKQSLP